MGKLRLWAVVLALAGTSLALPYALGPGFGRLSDAHFGSATASPDHMAGAFGRLDQSLAQLRGQESLSSAPGGFSLFWMLLLTAPMACYRVFRSSVFRLGKAAAHVVPSAETDNAAGWIEQAERSIAASAGTSQRGTEPTPAPVRQVPSRPRRSFGVKG